MFPFALSLLGSRHLFLSSSLCLLTYLFICLFIYLFIYSVSCLFANCLMLDRNRAKTLVLRQ